jgi:AcrR family transcriptional regulator
LRPQIIAATKDLLARTGNTDDVSIRAVADEVGVTSPSIYLHFADKEALINAAVADVFADLDRAIQERAATVTGPMNKILAAGLAYVSFATSHPEHYRIAMMSPHGRSKELDDVLADSAFANFHALVLDCARAGIFAPPDPITVSFGLWTAAHGIAALLIAKPDLPWGDVEAFTYRTLCAAGMGQGLFDHRDESDPTRIGRWLDELELPD